MIRSLQFFLLSMSLFVFGFGIYQLVYRDSSHKWQKFAEPKLAAYASLQEDEAILKELDRQTRFNSYKPLDAMFFVKPNIFQRIERR